MPTVRVQPSDFERKLRAEFAERLAALEPAVDEHERLTAALELLERDRSAPAAKPVSPTRDARSKTPQRAAHGSPSRKPSPAAQDADVRLLPPVRTARRRAARHPTPTLAKATFELVAAEPGLRIPELAIRLDCLHNPLYTILGEYERERRLVKKGRAWHPVPGHASPPTAREIVNRVGRPTAQAA
jgi:hypothetical protein